MNDRGNLGILHLHLAKGAITLASGDGSCTRWPSTASVREYLLSLRILNAPDGHQQGLVGFASVPQCTSSQSP